MVGDFITEDLPPNTVLCRPGESANTIFFVEEGELILSCPGKKSALKGGISCLFVVKVLNRETVRGGCEAQSSSYNPTK